MELGSLSMKFVWILSVVFMASMSINENQVTVKVVRFNSKYGNDSLCLEDQSSIPCKTLDLSRHVLEKYKKNVMLEIQEDSDLSKVIVLEGSDSIIITGVLGNNSKLPVIQCIGNSGFNVKGTQNFSLQYLSLLKCNVQNDSTFLYGYAIAVKESHDVSFVNITISNSTRTAMHFSNCTGTILLHGVVLDSNGHSMLTLPASFSAGIHIDQSRMDQKRVYYIIEHCSFSSNTAPIDYDDEHVEILSILKNIGYGGAIYVKFSGSTSSSSLEIRFCNFDGNNGVRGGGLYAYYDGSASKNKIIVHHSTFSKNYGRYSGGAISFGYSSKTFTNIVIMSHCMLTENRARFGAGLAIFSEYGHAPSDKRNIINVTNCSFLRNKGTLSSAIDIAPKDPDQDKNGFLPGVCFINCIIKDNKLGIYNTKMNLNKPNVHHINSGVVVITRFKVYFGGNINFTNNQFSALVVVSATVEFMPHSDILFCYNLGYNGGAVGLYGFSQITLTHNLNLKFYRNRALNHGGAIVYRTIDQHNLISGKNCFFRHKDLHNEALVRTTSVTFENNKAEVAGASIYSESFTDCYYQCLDSDSVKDSDKMYFNYSDITNCLGKFVIIPDSTHKKQLISVGRSFLFQKDFNFTISVIPGNQVKLPFSVVDDFNQTVNPLMTINRVNSSYRTIEIDQKYTLNTTISPKGEPGEFTTFQFSVVGVRQIYFYFNVSLLPCPPGYYQRKKVSACKCADKEKGYRNIIGCSDFQAKVRLGLWVGYIGEINYKNLYFTPCASPICASSSSLFSANSSGEINLLPRDPAALSTHVCDDYRTGILCGACSSEYSTYYHSREFKCKPNKLCHLGWLFYILSEVILMVIFFVVVVTFDFSLTSGKAVGFIFFTQYLDKLTVHIDEEFMYLRTPYRTFYGLFNFEFFNIEFLSFCPWKGSQILDVVALKYVTIGLALGLVLALVGLLRNNRCTSLCHLRRHISSNTSVVHGLSAFLVICYAQSSRTTFYILKYTTPSGFNGSTTNQSYSYYGGLPYLKKDHLIYAIPAFISLVFITSLPPLILLFYPLSLQLLSLCRLSEHWLVLKLLRFLCIHKLIPFIDCFQSCYKDKYRFFAGLYFLYRIIILICFSIDPQKFEFHVYSEVALVIFLSIHCVTQPYKKRLHNILDSLVFANLTLINGIAILTEQINQQINSREASSSSRIIVFVISAVQLVLLYLPMIALFGAFSLKAYRHYAWLRWKYGLEQVATNEVLEYSRRTYEDSIQENESPLHMKNYGSIRTP